MLLLENVQQHGIIRQKSVESNIKPNMKNFDVICDLLEEIYNKKLDKGTTIKIKTNKNSISLKNTIVKFMCGKP